MVEAGSSVLLHYLGGWNRCLCCTSE